MNLNKEMITFGVVALICGAMYFLGGTRPADAVSTINRERRKLTSPTNFVEPDYPQVHSIERLDRLRNPDDIRRFVDGREEPYEGLVLATGYDTGLSRWIDGFEAIADDRGRPHRFGQETAIAGLYFVGFRNPSTGALREIAREAPRVAAGIQASLAA